MGILIVTYALFNDVMSNHLQRLGKISNDMESCTASVTAEFLILYKFKHCLLNGRAKEIYYHVRN